MKVKSLSHVRLFATPWTIASQAPLSMGFSRQEYWSGLPFPSPGDLPNPGVEPGSPALQADALSSQPPGKPKRDLWHNIKHTNIRIIGVPEEEKKKGYEKIFEEIIVENFPNIEKEIVNQVQEAQRVPYRIDQRETCQDTY